MASSHDLCDPARRRSTAAPCTSSARRQSPKPHAPRPEQSALLRQRAQRRTARELKLVELVLEESDLDGPPPNETGGPFVAFILITTEVVQRDHELTWAYGTSYAPNRTYRAGAPAAASCGDFNIRDVFPDGVPVRAVSDYVPTGGDSSQSSGDDSEFVGAAFSRCVI